MGSDDRLTLSRRERLTGLWDEVRTSFGFFPGLAMVAGAALGFGLPALDDLFELQVPVFAFETQDAARSLLSTIATVTSRLPGSRSR